MPALYIIATPIGNLEDITLRALRVLKQVDLILSEDTRQTQKLLNFYNIETPTLSYHQHSRLAKVEHIVKLIKAGRSLALVSEAGTPGISDPGGKLVNLIVGELGGSVEIICIPGPSALAGAASVSGLKTDSFLFLGFLPTKKGRETLFKEIAASKRTVIFYESPHRIIKTLNRLNELISDKQIAVCRELTKKFETVYRGTIREALNQLSKDKIKGEFVVVIGAGGT